MIDKGFQIRKTKKYAQEVEEYRKYLESHSGQAYKCKSFEEWQFCRSLK